MAGRGIFGTDPGHGRRREAILACAVAAAVVAGVVVLLQRVVSHDTWGMPAVLVYLVDFVLIFLLYLASPWLGPRSRRFFHGPQGE